MDSSCPRCGEPIREPQALFCPACGKGLTAQTPGISTALPATLPPVDPAVAAAIAGARCAAHPERPARDVCSRCGNFACVTCVQATPEGQAVCSACASRLALGRWEVPWEHSAELGLFKAYWETAKAATFTPQRAFSGLSPAGSWWDAMSYAMVSTMVSSLGMLGLYAAIFGIAAIAGGARRLGGAEALVVLGVVAAIAVLLPVSALVRVYVGAGIDHLGLMIAGGGKSGFDATLRTYCYSMSPAMFGLVPGCGVYVWEVWRIVLAIIGYREVHKMSGGRAAAAVLVPYALCCGGYVVLVMGTTMFALPRGH